jgi:hypothetical protein
MGNYTTYPKQLLVNFPTAPRGTRAQRRAKMLLLAKSLKEFVSAMRGRSLEERKGTRSMVTLPDGSKYELSLLTPECSAPLQRAKRCMAAYGQRGCRESLFQYCDCDSLSAACTEWLGQQMGVSQDDEDDAEQEELARSVEKDDGDKSRDLEDTAATEDREATAVSESLMDSAEEAAAEAARVLHGDGDPVTEERHAVEETDVIVAHECHLCGLATKSLQTFIRLNWKKRLDARKTLPTVRGKRSNKKKRAPTVHTLGELPDSFPGGFAASNCPLSDRMMCTAVGQHVVERFIEWIQLRKDQASLDSYVVTREEGDEWAASDDPEKACAQYCDKKY